jgi:hypothetical protein
VSEKRWVFSPSDDDLCITVELPKECSIEQIARVEEFFRIVIAAERRPHEMAELASIIEGGT